MRRPLRHRRGPAVRRGQVPHEGMRPGDDEMNRVLMFGSLALFVASSAASCAQAEESDKKDEAATASVPQIDAAIEASVDAGPAPIEAGCDAADKGCVDHVISCADVPWCPTVTTVSSQYALTAIWG